MADFRKWKSSIPPGYTPEEANAEREKLLRRVGYTGLGPYMGPKGGDPMYEAYKKLMSPEVQGRMAGERQAAVNANLAQYQQSYNQGKWAAKNSGGKGR